MFPDLVGDAKEILGRGKVLRQCTTGEEKEIARRCGGVREGGLCVWRSNEAGRLRHTLEQASTSSTANRGRGNSRRLWTSGEVRN